MSRDVTKLEFDDVRTSNVSPDSKFNKCFKRLLSNANFWKNPCSKTDFVCTDSQQAQTNQLFFSNSTCHTNYSNI